MGARPGSAAAAAATVTGRFDRCRLAVAGAWGCRRSLPTHFLDWNSRPDWRERVREAVGGLCGVREQARGNRRAERHGSLAEVPGR